MDTQNSGILSPTDSLAQCPRQNLVVGAKQIRKALLKNQGIRVFLARNADPLITQPLADLCLEKQVEIIWVPTMAELGRFCRIEVGAAAAAHITGF